MTRLWKIKCLLGFIIVTVGVFSLYSCVAGRGTMEHKFGLNEIQVDMTSLADCTPADYPESIRYYFDYFGLSPEDEIEGVEHLFGTFQSQGFDIAAHIYKPAVSKGTVVLMHGYMNHCGQLNHIIPYLLSQGYAVCAYDMPGHGLSAGLRGGIDDFDKYSNVLDDFNAVVKTKTEGPYHIIAFSHGTCPVTQQLLDDQEDFFDKVVLCAPLIRPVQWKKAQATYRLYWFFKKDVKRIVRRNTSDKQFLEFNSKKDFLHIQRVPLLWVKSLEKWNAKIEQLSTSEKKILIIQGDKDSTVDWRYNTKFLEKKLKNAKRVMIPGAKHELFNEKQELKEKVFEEIGEYLAGE